MAEAGKDSCFFCREFFFPSETKRVFSCHKQNMTKLLRGVLVGDYNVGKTSLVRRIFDNKWEPSQSTIGVEFRSGVVFDNTKISIWDTGGSERYRSIIPMYFRNVDFIFIVLDKTDPNINDTYCYWKGLVRKHANPSTPYRVLVNKRDLVSKEDAVANIDSDAYYVSAKVDKNQHIINTLLPFFRTLIPLPVPKNISSISKPRDTVYTCCN